MSIRTKSVAAVLVTLAVLLGAAGVASAVPPPYEPDGGSIGSLTFYDASGNVITTGNVNDAPFAAYVQASHAGRAGDTKATLYGYSPKNGVPTGSWSGEQLTASPTYPKPTAPAPLNSSPLPLVSLTAADSPLSTLIGDFPNTAVDSYQGLYQLRVKTSGPGQPAAATYDSADILVTGSTWTLVYPAPVPQATTISLAVAPPSPQPAGTSVTLTATVSPSNAAGSVQFLDGASAIGAPVTVVAGSASKATSALTVGGHSLTAVFTPANPPSNPTAFTGSTSSAVPFTVATPPFGFTSAATTTFTVGQAGSFLITTAGSPAPNPTVTSTSLLPAGVTLVDNGNGTATLAGTPGPATAKTWTVKLTAKSGAVKVAQTLALVVTSAPSFTSPSTVPAAAGKTVAITIKATGNPLPTITPDVSLPSWLTVSATKPGQLSLRGTAPAGPATNVPFTVSASNGVGAPVSQSLTVQIGAISSSAATTFVVGQPGSFLVTTSNLVSPLTVTTASVLPAGLTLVDNGNGTATLAGTPAPGTAKVWKLVVVATSGKVKATQSLLVTVDQAPAFTSATSVAAAAGKSLSLVVKASGLPLPTITPDGSLPAWLTVSATKPGQLSLHGTAPAGAGGVVSFTLTASNGIGAPVTQSFTVQVLGFSSAASTTFSIGHAGSFLVTTSNTPANPTITTVSALPAGVTLVDNGNGTATLSGTPAPGTAKTWKVVIVAISGAVTVTQSFSLVITS